METLFSLMPLVLGLLALAVGALIWAIKSGQFDDLEGPAHRILFDDDDPRIPFNRPDRKDDQSAPGEERDGDENNY